VPESAEAKAARKALARAAERRRLAVRELRLAESLCGYAAGQLANGLSAEQARLAALETAGELVAVAAVLRRAAWTTTADRRRLAAVMAGRGLPTKQIADRLGVSDWTVRAYLRGRPQARRPSGSAARLPGS
jgi:DNA-binding NarL/FixJ family response regulator